MDTQKRNEHPDANPLGLKTVTLRLLKVQCIHATSELGPTDELVAAAITLGADVDKAKGALVTKARAAERLKLGEFKNDDVRVFSEPRILATFSIGADSDAWPRRFLARVLLIEQDGESDAATIVNQAVAKLSNVVIPLAATELTAVATAAAVGAGLGSAVPLVGSLAGMAVGALGALGMGALAQARKDDVFPACRAEYELKGFPEARGDLETSTDVADFRGFKGHYRLTYSFRAQ